MKYQILKDFKGSPDGRFSVEYRAGQTVELTSSLAEVALAEKWCAPVAETPPPTEMQIAKTSKEKKARKN